jgi:ComF family protein
MWTIRAFISKTLSILFPAHCFGCGKEGFSLCPLCLKSCKKSIDTPTLYITSIYSFRDPLIKKAIHSIKYFHRRDLIEPLTKELVEVLKVGLMDQEINLKGSLREPLNTTSYKLMATNWTLVPIPMPTLRKYVRGYNQAELIARELSQQCSLPIATKILTRIHSPKRQVTTRTRGERLQNQHNSFKVINSVKNMHIILVDDVITTGATLFEARKVLLHAGATSVRAVTLAH